MAQPVICVAIKKQNGRGHQRLVLLIILWKPLLLGAGGLYLAGQHEVFTKMIEELFMCGRISPSSGQGSRQYAGQ